MKMKPLITLLLVAAGVVALAIVSAHRRQATPPTAVGKPVLPKLNLEAVSRIEITRTAAPIVIRHTEDGWQVANLYGYPADLGKLRTDLLKLKDLKIGNVARGMSLETNAVTLVDLQDASGKPLATLRLAERASNPDPQSWRSTESRYLSVAGNPAIYRVKDPLDDFDGDAKTWVDAQLLNVSSSDIQMIEMSSPTGTVVTLSRDTGSLQLQDLSSHETFDASGVYGIDSAFSYLTFAGVANPALTDAQTGLTTPHVYRVHLKNGETYTARIGAASTNGDHFVRLSFECAATGTNAVLKAAQEKRKAELDPLWSKWTYLISDTTAQNMMRSRASLVKPKTDSTNQVNHADAH